MVFMRPDLTTEKQFHSMQSQAPLVEVTECFNFKRNPLNAHPDPPTEYGAPH